jgi:two-component system phosphate regulon sensor histidine kinase PhoR
LKNIEEEFSLTVRQALSSVAEEVQVRELRYYFDQFETVIDSAGSPETSEFRDVFLFYDNDAPSNLSALHAFGILEEEYNVPVSSLDNATKSNKKLKDFKGVRTTTILKETFDRENRVSLSIEKLKDIKRINAFEQATYKAFFSDLANTFPIHKRLNSYELEVILQRSFIERNIITPFEFGVFSDGLATKVSSNNYIENQKGPQYSVPLFLENEGVNTYDLVVSFPEKNSYLSSSIVGITFLSLALTLLIIIVCAYSIYEIVQQKKISEIKSDFINNMSHEFKTPIATINLAIDALKNKNVKDDSEKVDRYLTMVREENKRMQEQVENVLMISQLDRGTTPLEIQSHAINKLVEEAISHVALIIKSKNGNLKSMLTAENQNVDVDKSHFMNVFVNLLDNAIKYSLEAPRVEVKTFNEAGNWVFEIKDHGIGMDSDTMKLIFKKFYRQQGGNIHNIKGHGLGLSYVKKIVELHNGTIHADSVKGEGTTFRVCLPLVNYKISV